MPVYITLTQNDIFVGAKCLAYPPTPESQTHVILHLQISPSSLHSHLESVLIKLSSAPEALLQVSFGQQQNSQRRVKKFNYPSHISPRMSPWRKLNVDLPIRLALQWNVIVLHNWMSGKTTGQTEAGCLIWTVLTQDVEKIRESEAAVRMDIKSVDNLLKKHWD